MAVSSGRSRQPPIGSCHEVIRRGWRRIDASSHCDYSGFVRDMSHVFEDVTFGIAGFHEKLMKFA